MQSRSACSHRASSQARVPLQILKSPANYEANKHTQKSRMPYSDELVTCRQEVEVCLDNCKNLTFFQRCVRQMCRRLRAWQRDRQRNWYSPASCVTVHCGPLLVFHRANAPRIWPPPPPRSAARRCGLLWLHHAEQWMLGCCIHAAAREPAAEWNSMRHHTCTP